jgi:hypothetical protein
LFWAQCWQSSFWVAKMSRHPAFSSRNIFVSAFSSPFICQQDFQSYHTRNCVQLFWQMDWWNVSKEGTPQINFSSHQPVHQWPSMGLEKISVWEILW